MRAALVVDAVRTPLGARGGRLAGWHPADLAGRLLVALAERTGLDPAEVDDVLLGCAMPVGSQGFNIGRNAVLAAGWPVSVPGGTIDRQAASSLAAVAAATAAVRSGAAELVVAGGVEVMSSTPLGATLVPGAMPFGPGVAERFRDAGGLVPGPVAAERLATALGLDRAALDAVAARSHERAAAAAPGLELVPVPARTFDRDKGEAVATGTDLAADERFDTGDLAELRPAFDPEGTVTAGNSAPAADGAAVVLVASEEAAARLTRTPLALLRSAVVSGVDPLHMLDAAPATAKALAAAGVEALRLARAEVAEPFAAVLVAWERAFGLDPALVNPAGGGIALGEPTGAVGARLLATLVHGLTTGQVGVAATPGVGGVGAAAVVERL